MEKSLIDALEELKKALQEDERVLLLEKKEKAMMENEEVLLLIAEKDRREREYEDLLSYSSDEGKKKEAEKLLYLAKKKLDEHPLVKEYTESYVVVRDLYWKIDDLLFSPYRKKVGLCSR